MNITYFDKERNARPVQISDLKVGDVVSAAYTENPILLPTIFLLTDTFNGWVTGLPISVKSAGASIKICSTTDKRIRFTVYPDATLILGQPCTSVAV